MMRINKSWLWPGNNSLIMVILLAVLFNLSAVPVSINLDNNPISFENSMTEHNEEEGKSVDETNKISNSFLDVKDWCLNPQTSFTCYKVDHGILYLDIIVPPPENGTSKNIFI